MTMTERDLRKWEESTFTPITAEQRKIILERFGTEPEPYDWTEQDICVQIRNFLGCGQFVKAISSSGKPSPLPAGMDF